MLYYLYYRVSMIVLFLINLGKATIHSKEPLPLWTWECINEKCVPISVKETIKLQTLATCNMLCASMLIWPQPTGHVSLSNTAVPIRAGLVHLHIVSNLPPRVRGYIENAFQLFRYDLHVLKLKNAGDFEEWRNVDVQVTMNGSADPRMLIDTDESYRIVLRPKTLLGSSLQADIFAQSFCGVRHAFETLSQLIWLDTYRDTLLMIETAQIEDAPRFSYRGLMIDTARTYYPITDLLRTIDAMGACKLNTFHWHASDSQAFSLQLTNVPELSTYGSYGTNRVYTSEDIRTVVHRARLRGIRVIIEINTPAHIDYAWDLGDNLRYGKLDHCTGAKSRSVYCNEPPCGLLNPQNPNVYEYLKQIFHEIIELTGVDDVFHIGGDDVSHGCFEKKLNDTNPIYFSLKYIRKLLQSLEIANGRLPNMTIMWASHLSGHIKQNLKPYIQYLSLQSRNVSWAYKHVSGVRTVISHENAWDLNSGFGNWYEEAGGVPYNSWQRVYEYRPWARNLGWGVRGGEATVWSSSLDSAGLDSRLWPRAAALAERLWTDHAEGVTRTVFTRFDVQRTRLLERGIQAAPIWSMWCTHNTYTCI